MARKARREILSGSGFYHVFSRGNRKQDIFFSDIDRKHFVVLIGECSDKYRVEIHAFCLMTNHFHMLIKADAVSMAKFLQRLLSMYTLRFNQFYDQVGHLFQGRYQSKPVEQDTYAMEVSRYIHNNPHELDPGNPVEAYPWSSLAGYVDPKFRNSFLRTEFILSYFSSPFDYLSFVKKGTNALHPGQSNVALSPVNK